MLGAGRMFQADNGHPTGHREAIGRQLREGAGGPTSPPDKSLGGPLCHLYGVRFLFAAIPEAGHVNPALPIVRALADAGHAVTFTTGPDLAAAVTAAGAGFVPLPEGAYWEPVTADRRYPHRRS